MNPKKTDYSEWMDSLKVCRKFDGSVGAFWNLLSKTIAGFVPSGKVRILAHAQDNWRVLAVSPEGFGGSPLLTRETLETLSQQAQSNGYARAEATVRSPDNLYLIRLDSEEPGVRLFAEWSFAELEIGNDDEFGILISLISDLPTLYNERLKQRRVERQLGDYSRALEVLTAVNAQRKFMPAAMALVNEVASRFDATRVCLGWVEGYYVKACAMSGTERFERKVEVVQRLEAAMEECRDQEEEVIYPAAEGIDTIIRSHEAYAQDAHISSVVSIPLRVDGDVCAVITLEKEQAVFTMEDLQSLRVIADQTAPILSDLKKSDRWFGKRWADSARELFEKAVGPRHTWMKIGTITLTAFVLFALLFPYTYRVKANFIVVPDSLALIPVPFNGYIDEVYHRPGDEISVGSILLRMDEGELLVEQARAFADLNRFQAEAELAEAQGNMGEFRVANELAGQAAARLQLAQYRLERSVIRAPFDGVLVEGDLRERLGSPVDQGEVLMKFSRLDGLYLEIELPERDIDLLDGSDLGEVAFASRPDIKFKASINRIEPSAMAGEGNNYFVVRAELTEASAEWLRPGMTGVARLDAGDRTLAWRATHRLIDFLRMFFWI